MTNFDKLKSVKSNTEGRIRYLEKQLWRPKGRQLDKLKSMLCIRMKKIVAYC